MKLGLLGGTFDPVHYAHLFIAEAARVELHLDRVLFLPTRLVHHREVAQASTPERLTMLRGAIAPNPFFAIDETDLADDATGYTADLMPKLRARFLNDHLTFIVGGDSLLDSPWQRFGDVLANLDAFVIAPRAEKRVDRLHGFLATLDAAAREKITLLDLPPLTTSATLVRSQIARGGSIRYLVPDFVARYVAERGLYAR
ncbi:MAG TPA: nicotinate (nicotinamide) nucleotide adenylyltransferase [Candidatus Acidoferrales bacterium]|nr:nicotinate (nicotinamide) nucleotide adenylyltransferase [Candidatus Acidoferrales bacterium]